MIGLRRPRDDEPTEIIWVPVFCKERRTDLVYIRGQRVKPQYIRILRDFRYFLGFDFSGQLQELREACRS